MSRTSSVSLGSFRKTISSKAVDTGKVQVRPNKSLNLPLAASMLRTVIGYEGMNVFPSLFSNPLTRPMLQNQTIDKIQQILNDHVYQRKIALDSPKIPHNAFLVSKIVSQISIDSNRSAEYEQEQVTCSAGWLTSNSWLEISTTADVCIFNSQPNFARENPELFSRRISSVPKISTEEKSLLTSSMPFRCFRGGNIDFYCSGNEGSSPRFLLLGIFDSKYSSGDGNLPITSIEDIDSKGLLFTASMLINQAWDLDLDSPQIGYSVICDGQKLRFLAFQLNSLELDDQSVPTDAHNNNNNASWLYECELFTTTGQDAVVNLEALRILQNIVVPTSKS